MVSTIKAHEVERVVAILQDVFVCLICSGFREQVTGYRLPVHDLVIEVNSLCG